MTIKTVGDLKKFLQDLPDDMPLMKLSADEECIHRHGVRLTTRTRLRLWDLITNQVITRSKPFLEIW